MLEACQLLIRDGAKTRPIVDAASAAPLGFARWARPRSWWQRGPLLEVREQQDSPLLFTVQRSWFPERSFQVRDAEGRVVGSVIGLYVKDRRGQRVARLCPEGDGGVFKNGLNRELASWSIKTAGRELRFRDEVWTEPFIKMLLLAAVLI